MARVLLSWNLSRQPNPETTAQVEDPIRSVLLVARATRQLTKRRESAVSRPPQGVRLQGVRSNESGPVEPAEDLQAEGMRVGWLPCELQLHHYLSNSEPSYSLNASLERRDNY